jgi:hypothetical protein
MLIVNRYVGLILAVSSSLAIGKRSAAMHLSYIANMLRPGTSFVITKKVRRRAALLTHSSSHRLDPAPCKRASADTISRA